MEIILRGIFYIEVKLEIILRGCPVVNCTGRSTFFMQRAGYRFIVVIGWYLVHLNKEIEMTKRWQASEKTINDNNTLVIKWANGRTQSTTFAFDRDFLIGIGNKIKQDNPNKCDVMVVSVNGITKL
jgi:hypothetical protein